MPRARRVANASDVAAQGRGAARDAGAAPGAEVLRQAALAHLARFSCSEASLIRVLERRIARWARRSLDLGVEPERIGAGQNAARAAIPGVVAELVRSGAVSDAGFAQTRTRVLSRGGRSSRSIAAHLAGHGIEMEVAVRALDDAAAAALDDSGQRELTAALLQARKRRIGPFAPDAGLDDLQAETAARRRALAALARAGFAHDVAVQALGYDREAAEILIARLRAS